MLTPDIHTFYLYFSKEILWIEGVIIIFWGVYGLVLQLSILTEIA